MTFDESQAASAKAYLEELMQRHRGNIVHAAREAGRCRTSFYRLLYQYEVKLTVRPAQARRGSWFEQGL